MGNPVLMTFVDLIGSPIEAFRTIAQRPNWAAPIFAILALAIAGALLNGPAQHHAEAAVVRAQFTTGYYSGLSQVQRDALLSATMHPPIWHDLELAATDFVIAVVGVVMTSVMFWLGAKVVGRTIPFRLLFAGVAFIGVLFAGLPFVATGIVTLLSGASQYFSYDQMDAAVPGLGWLSPHASGRTVVFLSNLSVFALWAGYLYAVMVRVFFRVSRASAAAVAVAVVLIDALVQAMLSGLQA